MLMSSVSMLSLMPLLTELLSSQLDIRTKTDTHRAEDRETHFKTLYTINLPERSG